MPGIYARLLSLRESAGRFVAGDRAAKLISRFLETPDRKEQVKIIHALGELGDPRAVETLETFSRAHHGLALRALDALESIPPRRSERAVLAFLESTDTEVALRAAAWLQVHGTQQALEALGRARSGVRLPEELAAALDQAIARVEARVALSPYITGSFPWSPARSGPEA
jgi:HEAT repeat protein